MAGKRIGSFDDEEDYHKFVKLGLQLRMTKNFDLRIKNGARKVNGENKDIKHTLLKMMYTNVEAKFKDDAGAFFEDGKADPSKEVVGKVGIDELVDCVCNGTAAINVLKANESNTKKMQQCFEHYLKNSDPGLWFDQFKNSITTAFFIKYMDQEDLQQAYDEFKSQNRQNKDWFVDKILQTGAIDRMPEPLVDIAKIEIEKEDSAQLILTQVEQDWQSEADPGKKVMFQVTLEWMKLMNERVSIPMALHHTQVITALCFAEFYKQKLAGTSPMHHDKDRDKHIPVTALIAQVGTGEGKSIVIATLAIYFVVVHGKKIHILENNQGLLDRDYNSFKTFYRNFSRKSDGAPIKVSDHLTADADICYCLNSQVDQFYRESVFAKGGGGGGGGSVFKNLIMIVDEVDELVVDKKPTSSYVKPDDEYSKDYQAAMKALVDNPDSEEKPEHISNEKMWTAAKSAKNQAARKREGADYGISDSKYVMLDSRGRVTNHTTPWLQWLNFKNNPDDVPPFQTTFYTNSTLVACARLSLERKRTSTVWAHCAVAPGGPGCTPGVLSAACGISGRPLMHATFSLRAIASCCLQAVRLQAVRVPFRLDRLRWW